MDKPFSLLVFALIIGIIITFYFNISIGIILFLAGVVLVLYLWNVFKGRPNNLNILFLFIFLGIIITQVNKSSKLTSLVEIRNDYVGRVEEVILSTEKESKYVVLVEEEDNSFINEKITLKVIGNRKLELGDRIWFNGVLKQPLENTNPMLYNHRLNLLSDKIHTSMTINDYSLIKVDKNNSIKYKIRTKFSNDVESLFKTHLNEKNSKLITSIILGKSSYLEEEELLKYRDLGLAHILAVSGLHIGIISGFLIFIFSRIGLKRRYNYIITLSIIWFYGYLIGYSPSTLRAIIMFTILFYSMSIHEPYDSLNTISFAMLVILLVNPFWLFSISFQLSFVATISIIVLTPKIVSVIYPYKGKILLTLAGIMGVNIGLFPIQAYYFNKIPLLGTVVNLITVPILSLSLIIGMLMIMLNYIFPISNICAGTVLNFLLNIEHIITNGIYGFPINILKIFSPNFIFMFLYYIFIGIIFKFIDIRKFDIKINKVIIFYLLILILTNSVLMSLDNNVEIHFIDVGQGDSILIKVAGKNYLIDTGGSIFDGFDIIKNITLPYLQKQGIFNLESIFISHFDEDHSQGLSLLVENLTVKNIYASYIPEDYSKLPITLLRQNDIINLGYNKRMEVLWPEANIERLSSNDKSLVLLFKCFDYSVLFTGDIEREVEEKTLHRLERPIDILKIAHHGSKTSSTEEFLDKAIPKNSIISVGRNNIYNHPNTEVVDRLNYIDSNIYRTDEMGLIKVIISDDGYEIIPFLDNRRSTSHYIIFYGLHIVSSYFLVIMYKRTREELKHIEL